MHQCSQSIIVELPCAIFELSAGARSDDGVCHSRCHLLFHHSCGDQPSECSPRDQKYRVVSLLLRSSDNEAKLDTVLHSSGSSQQSIDNGPVSCRGSAGAVALVCYYTAPLSTLVKVVRTKDSSSLHVPLCIMNFFNMVLWLSYGAAIHNPFIW